jgi:hypothetical protein
MKRPVSKNEPVAQEFIESAKRHGDSKSIFGLLLLLEREICFEARHSCSEVAPPEDKKLVNRQAGTVFRGYVE